MQCLRYDIHVGAPFQKKIPGSATDKCKRTYTQQLFFRQNANGLLSLKMTLTFFSKQILHKWKDGGLEKFRSHG